jgi:hypothetical protein
MKQRMVAAAAALVLFAATASPAFADRGAPGSTFPEQPGTHIAIGCATVLANVVTGATNDSDVAFAIQSGLIADACF